MAKQKNKADKGKIRKEKIKADEQKKYLEGVL